MDRIKYYEDNVGKIFNSVENARWRVWKILDEDNIIHQNKFQITTPEKLLKFIKKYNNPKALYCSISTFLNAHKNHGFMANQRTETKEGHYFYPKPGYIYADCIMLDTCYFIDIDNDDLRQAQRDTRAVIYKLQEIGMKPSKIQFSGRRGFHVLYSMPRVDEPDPVERIKKYKAIKKAISKSIQHLFDRTHLKILEDNFRVYAAPYSLKDNNQIVQPIDYDVFMNKDLHLFLRHPTRDQETKATTAMEAQADDNKVAPSEGAILHPQQYSGSERDSLISPTTYFKFVDNMVNGLKNNYITVIKKHKTRFNEKEIIKLQQTYKLSDFVVYQIGDYIYAYCTKLNQFRRQVKIMRKFKSENLNYFISRRHSPIQITSSYDNKHNIISPIKFIKVLRSKYGLNHTHSRPHSKLLNLNYNNLSGENWSDIRPCHEATMRSIA